MFSGIDEAKKAPEVLFENMTQCTRLARFAVSSKYESLSANAVAALKARVLDSLGCALGALHCEPMALLREHLLDMGGREAATCIGGGRTAPDRVALYNGALVRYLDFNDAFLAPKEICHPSDNLAAVLAAGEYAQATGRDVLTALAVAYQVQGRLSEKAPVWPKGFDHTTHLAYSAAAGVARVLGLDEKRAAHAIAISGTSNVGLRVARTGRRSNWKGLAGPWTEAAALECALVARSGSSGPLEVFEGNKGFEDAVAGRFDIDWQQEDLELVKKTILKRYDAAILAQSAIEGILELLSGGDVGPDDVSHIDVEVFQGAFSMLGAGEEGARMSPGTKEDADHSLPYMIAAAFLDGSIGPEQYRPERIRRDDVQRLMRRVFIFYQDHFDRFFPDQLPCRVRIFTRDGRTLETEKHDYEGFHTRPMSWEAVVAKFSEVAAPNVEPVAIAAIVGAVSRLEDIKVAELMTLLGQIKAERRVVR